MSSSQHLQNNHDGATKTPIPEVGQHDINNPITNSRSTSNGGYSFHRFVITETTCKTIGISLGFDRKIDRVRIKTIDSNSIADKAGIKVGDVILPPKGYTYPIGPPKGYTNPIGSKNLYHDWLTEARHRPLSICFEVKRQEVSEAKYSLHHFIITKSGNLGITFQQTLHNNWNDEEYIACVEKVTRGSLGHAYGIQPSDYVRSAYISGTEIKDFGTLVEQAENEGGCCPITIVVMREIGSYTNKLKAQEGNVNPFTFSFSSQENVKATSAEEAGLGMYHMFAVSNHVMLSLAYFSIIATFFFFL